jgi:hypothetical protein
MFATYPTTTIKPGDMIKLLQLEPVAYYKKLYSLSIHNFGLRASDAFCEKLIATISAKPGCTVADFLVGIPKESHAITVRTIIGFAKIGLIAIGTHNL